MKTLTVMLCILGYFLIGSTTLFASAIVGDPSLGGASLAINYDLRADTSVGLQASGSMTSATTPIVFSQQLSGTNIEGYTFASASGHASYAGLGISASGVATPSDPHYPIVGNGNAQATAEDAYFVPGAVGDRLSVTARFSGSGTFAGSFDVGSVLGISLQLGNGSPSCVQDFENLVGSISFTCTVTTTITDNPIPVTFGLSGSGGAENGSASVNALDTFKITAVSVIDPNGNPVNSATIYDASGYNYNQPTQAPEVSSVCGVSIGIALIGALIMMRR